MINKKKTNYYKDSVLNRLIYFIFAIYSIYLFFLFFINKEKFWKYLLFGIIIIILFFILFYYVNQLKANLRRYQLNKLINKVKHAGYEDYIKNFINRFGLSNNRNSKGWGFRGYFFEWERIKDLLQILKEKRIVKNYREVIMILKFYIQEKEYNLTKESIVKEPQKFASLTGREFEELLYRLFQAMGYKVQLVGKMGDQGGDLILNKGKERILVQAKCYRDNFVGNKAIQQAVAALKYYDCNKAMVVTTSYFSEQAIDLAKANNVELINKDKLQNLLLEYLNESWS